MKVVQISESAFTVQGHGVHTAYIETLEALKKVPGITVTTNDKLPADIRHIHTIGTYALWQLLFLKGKKIVSAHIVPDSLVGSLRGASWWKGLAAWYLKFFYNLADAVIAVSDETKQDLLKLGVKTPIYVIYNMINTEAYRPQKDSKRNARKKLGFRDDDWIIVSNGQVQPRKRVDIFVNLASEMPKDKFAWIGGIPFKAAAASYESMKKIMTEAPKNVQFTGVIDPTEVKDYFHAADVFIMPSDQETFGLAIVEAAASDLPVVLRDTPDYDKTFRSFSLLCSEDGFVETLRRLRNDQKLYDEMVEKSRQLARKYDSKTIVKDLVKLYKKVLNG